MIIRRAAAHDAEAIYTIWDQRPRARPSLGTSAGMGFRSHFDDRIAHSTREFGFWVAVVDDCVVGFSAAQRMRNNPALESTQAEVSIYVEATRRRQGVGRALLGRIHEAVVASDIEWLLGFSAADNVGSLRLFKSCGWIELGMIPTPTRNPARPPVVIIGHALHPLAAEQESPA